jgi:AcrR family transcriptional regulator
VEADARKAILEAALAVIRETGLPDMSMREVARRAGVSHQLPYHYFTDREGILAAIAESGFAELDRRLTAVIDGKGTGAEKLAHAGRAYVEFACEHAAQFRVMFRQDFVALDRFPSAEQCATDCFSKLPRIVMQLKAEGLLDAVGDEGSFVLLGWSIAHGLSCLILDGPLAKTVPDAVAMREATTAAVMTTIQNLVENATKKKPAKKR